MWLPASLHRALLPVAHNVRHHWRRWRKTPISGCSIILTNRAGAILLLRHSYGPDVWALAGGGISAGEDPQAAALREVHEELGLTLGKIEPVKVITEVISGSPHTAHLFAATTDQPPQPDRREIIDARFFRPDELPAGIGRTTRARLDMWRQWLASQSRSQQQ